MESMHRRCFLGAVAGAAVCARPFASSSHAEETDRREVKKPGRTKNTKFAVNVEAWFPKLPFVERIKRVADWGFPAIEFWPWERQDINAIAKACKQYQIEVAQFTAWGFKPGLNDPANHAAFVKKVEAGCQVAKRLKCRKMTVVGGDDIPGVSQEQMHADIIEGLKRGAAIAEKHKVMLILEPMNVRVDHKGHCLYGSEPTVRICRAVDSPFVKINWDLYHMQISEGDLCGRLKDGFDQLGYVQIADHPGRKEPGTGEIYYPRVFRQLQELGYDDYVGMELWPSKDEWTAAQAIHRTDQW